MGKKQVLYYIDRRGRSPIYEHLEKLTKKEQQKIGAIISLLEECGEELRRPLADYVGDKIYELRA